MQLKTYRAGSMTEALAEVKKDLGADAVILHTRTYKTGGMLGMGTKPIVEVTASNGSPNHPQQQRRRAAQRQPARAGTPTGESVPSRDFEPVAFDRVELGSMRPEPSHTPLKTPDAASPKPHTPIEVALPIEDSKSATRRSAGPKQASVQRKPEQVSVRTPMRPANGRGYAALEAELASIKRMVGQVLRASRRDTPAGDGLGLLPEPLFKLYSRLTDNDVTPELAEALCGEVRDALDLQELADERCVRDAMVRVIARRLPVAEVIGPSTARRVIALVGPTGVGKTTTVAKLAAGFKLRQGKRVGLVTSDTYRIAAVEQLRTYAEIIGLPLKVAITPEEMRAGVESFADCDVVIIDTAGRSQMDGRRLDELATFLEAGSPDERHLVLSSTISHSVMADAADRFGVLKPERLIVTKMDEALCHGPVLNTAVRVGLPISYITTGQEVPDHIERAEPERIAALVVDGSQDR
ncbi:MAG: flagellar biosynthesis protein FlhF [Planctomycetota bacterium]